MAIYHLNAKIISRSAGKSAVAAAAYRAGEKLTDKRLSKNFDYTKKRGIDSSVILAPENAPSWVSDRERLWNEVERVERLKNSQLAREFNIALPVELELDRMKNLALGYVREQFVARGMIADVAFHNLETHNPHFHVMLTTRHVTERGFGKKNRDWNSRKLLVQQRKAWADCVNNALEEIGRVDQKIDERTLVAQGIEDRIAQVHLGTDLHRIRAEHIERGKLQEFRDRYWLGDLYETIAELNRELAGQYMALEEINKLIVVEGEVMEEVTQKTTQNVDMKEELSEETASERERQSNATAESIAISEGFRGITEDFTSSSRQAEENRRRLQGLTDRLRGSCGEVGGGRKPGQSAGDSTGVKSKKSTQSSGRETGLPEKDAQVRTGVGDKPNPEQSRKDQQELSHDLGSGKKGQEADPRVAGMVRQNRTAQGSGLFDTAGQSADLGLDEALSPQLGDALQHGKTAPQDRNQVRALRETEKSLKEQQRLNSIHGQAIATIIRLMEYLDQETFEGKRYRLKVKDDGEIVKMYALDGRGLIFQKKGGHISGQLSDEDVKALEQLNGQLDRAFGQRQVNNCMPVLFRLLDGLGDYRQDNSVRFLSFEEATGIMTYRDKENPSDFLIAQWSEEQGWQYLDGKLTLEGESAIVVDLDRWLRQQAQFMEQEREEGPEL